MKTLFLFFSLFLFSIATAIAAGEGTYGNETYGNYSYGVSSSASASASESVSVTAATNTTINATTGAGAPNVTIELDTNASSSGTVTIVKYTSQPASVGTNTFSSPLNRYIDIVVDNSVSSVLDNATIKMFYTDAEVSAANLQESTLRLSRWNGTAWAAIDSPDGGVDTNNNFVFAKTSHFSVWGLFGTTVPTPAPAPSGGGGGGGGGSGGGGNWGWQCSAWSECTSAGTQTRTCNLVPGGGLSTKPAESQTCTYAAPAPATEEAPTAPTPTAPTTPAATSPAPTAPITGAAVAPPTGFGKLTGALISDLKEPGTWMGIIVAVLVLAGLYAGYHYLYKKK